MSEDTTRNLPSSFEERVLAELSSMRAEFSRRFDSIETRMGSIETRMTSMETRMTSMENRMDSMENRMGSMEARLTSLEDKVDARLRETRPIWESVQAQLKGIDKRLDTLNRQFKTVIQDLYDLRIRIEKLEDSQPIE